MKNKTALTLAEILIALGVIGVVAAVTMPIIIKNYQKQVTVSRLKKAYTSVSNAVQMSKIENGEVKEWDIKFDDKLQDASDFADKYLIPYMKVVKACKTNQTGDCNIVVKLLNGTDVSYEYKNFTRFYAADGVLYIVGSGRNSNDNIITSTYSITIDINGNNFPNTLGKDIFKFHLYINDGIVKANFANSSASSINENCKTNSGYSCAAKIIRDGWKIEKSYPW